MKKIKILIPALAATSMVVPPLVGITSCEPAGDTNFKATSFSEEFALENTDVVKGQDYVTKVTTNMESFDFDLRDAVVSKLIVGGKQLTVEEDFSFVPNYDEPPFYRSATLTIFAENVTGDVSVTFDYTHIFNFSVVTKGFSGSTMSSLAEGKEVISTITSEELDCYDYSVDKVICGGIEVPEANVSTTGYHDVRLMPGKQHKVTIDADWVVGDVEISLKDIRKPRHNVCVLDNDDKEFSTSISEIRESDDYGSQEITVYSANHTYADFKVTHAIINGVAHEITGSMGSGNYWKVFVDNVWIKGDISFVVERHFHELSDKFVVKNSRLYGLDAKTGDEFKLSDEQLNSLEGDFLACQVDWTYKLYKHDSPDLTPKTIADFIEKADREQIWGYELYLIKGTYSFTRSPLLEKTLNTFYIRGILPYDEEATEPLAAVKFYNGEDEPGEIHPINFNKLKLLQFSTLEILGSQRTDTRWDWVGVNGIDMLYFMNCYINGKVLIRSDTMFFNGCVFNSTDIVLDENNKTDYCIWLHNAQYAYFYWCDFYSRGKAIKIYQEETSTRPSQYALSHCNFYINGEVPTPSGSDRDENKCCVEIQDSSTYTIENPLYIYYKDCGGDYNTVARGEAGYDDQLHDQMVGNWAHTIEWAESISDEAAFYRIKDQLPPK